MAKPISEYTRKRNFTITSEPQEETPSDQNKKASRSLLFVIQKHDARRLHYDFRLEFEGTLKSWAIPKGPSLDPKIKRLAVHVEDHPISYAKFEGSIPKGQYGGGDVIVWDQGVWQPLEDPARAYKNGKIKFTLVGEKLTGIWNLVRTNLRGSGAKEQWLLIKERDESARSADEYDIVEEQPHSVLSGNVLSSKILTQKIPSKTKVVSAKKSSPTSSIKPSSQKIIIPDTFSPELATLVSEPPAGNWKYEIKFDGYRLLTRIQKGKVHFFTRNGNDWTERLPLQAKALAALKLKDSWLDGEVVVLNDQGLPDFQRLQSAFDADNSHDIIYYLFDAPYLNGYDLRDEPLEFRRAELEKIILSATPSNSILRFSKAFTDDHQNLLASACAMSLEGIIGKKSGSPYYSRRSSDWIKLKCKRRQEFVIVGYTQPQGSRHGFGALLLAVNEDSAKPGLRYVGRVGTGFTEKTLTLLYKKMNKLITDKSPLSHSLTGIQTKGVQWIKPVLVCEAEFAEWTGNNILRQAAFIALRTDKSVSEIIQEKPSAAKELLSVEEKSIAQQSSKKVIKKIAAHTKSNMDETTVSITHPDRIIDPESKATKKDVAMFYSKISEWILPHLDNRPASILRAPTGIDGKIFFQKHAEHLDIPNIKHLDRTLDPGHAPLMEIDTPQALVGAIQMGTIELHTWGSTSDNIEKPDRIILDLDPDPALPWRSMVEATQLTLSVLEELKLKAYLKTTGGKGMHIVIPLAPVAEWDYIKEFSKAIAQFMAREIPERFVAKMGPKNRIGKIFIDYLRNQRGASTVSAYSVRARSNLPVSVPITHAELLTISSSTQWNIRNLEQRLLKLKTDPWDGYNNRQKITQSLWKKIVATASK